MKTKLEQFKERNQKRNAHLYASNLTEGYDYVVCPVSQERVSMIKDNYITAVLEMKVEDYPVVQRICNKRKENIKSGLKQIDTDSGLSKYEVGQQKARKILSAVGKDGITGYKKKGQKTRNTHMSKIDKFGKNGYAQIASKAILKGNATKVEKGLILAPYLRNEFYRYKAIVTYLTEKQRSKLNNGYVTGLAGKLGAWQVDHNYSIMHGFVNKVSPLVIGSKENLRMLPWKENLQKHSKSHISLNDLFSVTSYTKERSDYEFKIILELVISDIENNTSPNGANLLERLYETTLPE